ncbi:MAG: TVP38/TMEM64 family protein [Chloroflexota bacterium]|nr:TVP38/TMEM64 family protein [Chloroflexota bacterium]
MSTYPQRAAVPPRTAQGVRRTQRALMLAIVILGTLSYLLIPAVQHEVARAVTILVAGDGAEISAYLRSYGVWAPVASLCLMVLQAVAAPVPSLLITFANGLAFGVFWGGLLTIAGQTLAAAVCFWMARTLGRDAVAALASTLGLTTVDRWITRWGAPGIAIARLIPGLSFDLISYAAGLTGIRSGPFLLATAVGGAPQAFLYAYLIRSAPQYAVGLAVGTTLVFALILAVAVVLSRRQVGNG